MLRFPGSGPGYFVCFTVIFNLLFGLPSRVVALIIKVMLPNIIVERVSSWKLGLQLFSFLPGGL